MKQGIHPEYVDCTVKCSCGNTFQTRSTKPELKIDICNVCHPFYTGQQRFVDTGGRVQRFADKFGAAKETAAVVRGENLFPRIDTEKALRELEAAAEAAKKAARAAAIAEAEAKKKAEREAKAAEKAKRAEEFAKKSEAEAKKAAEAEAAAETAPEATAEEAAAVDALVEEAPAAE